jgi:hypothetical protein
MTLLSNTEIFNIHSGVNIFFSVQSCAKVIGPLASKQSAVLCGELRNTLWGLFIHEECI